MTPSPGAAKVTTPEPKFENVLLLATTAPRRWFIPPATVACRESGPAPTPISEAHFQILAPAWSPLPHPGKASLPLILAATTPQVGVHRSVRRCSRAQQLWCCRHILPASPAILPTRFPKPSRLATWVMAASTSFHHS